MRLIYIMIGVIFIGLIVFSVYNSMVKSKKIVVFDMDETLGHFVQLGSFVDIIEYNDITLTQRDFNELLDLYPELLRPDIFKILEYVAQKKKKKQCSGVYIYTNNQGPKSWGISIMKYFHNKLNYSLFDDLIGAYKIRGLLNEPRRSTNYKTYDDIKTITKVDNNTQICFLDDQRHEQMIHPNIFYIYVPDYTQTLSNKEMVGRFLESSLYNRLFSERNKALLKKHMIHQLSQYNFTSRTNTPMNEADITTLDIMKYVKNFFKTQHQQKTKKRKRNMNRKNRTRKT